MELKYLVNKSNTYSTVKEVLKAHFHISDRLLLKLKCNNSIFLNGQIANVNARINENDLISIKFNYCEDNSNIIAVKMNLDILYEDECFIVLNKPAGIPVHPSMDHFEDSLSNGLKFYFDSINLQKKIRPVNRLDKNTSGIVIFAKNEYVQEALIQQMKTSNFYKEYIAICDGLFNNKNNTINAPIARKENSIIERCVNPNGEKAITKYSVLNYNEKHNFSIVKCVLETGRTHQIRVHMNYIGHSILGDTLYGKPSPLISRQALHSFKVKFIHPITKTNLSIVSPLPDDMLKLIDFEKNFTKNILK